MKKFILSTLFIMTAVAGAFAQASTKGIGVTASYGTEISSLGIGAKIQYNYTDPIRFELSADKFFKADYTSEWDINLNAHYVFYMSPKVNIYPLVGLTYTNWKFDYDGLTSDLGDLNDKFDIDYSTDSKNKHLSRIGANVGIGAEYNILSNVSLNFELKYQLIKDFNQVVFGVGATYKFR